LILLIAAKAVVAADKGAVVPARLQAAQAVEAAEVPAAEQAVAVQPAKPPDSKQTTSLTS
jgi:hypothetical protein